MNRPTQQRTHHATIREWVRVAKDSWALPLEKPGLVELLGEYDALVARVAELEAALYEIANGGLLPLTGDDLHDAYHTIEALKQVARNALAKEIEK